MWSTCAGRWRWPQRSVPAPHRTPGWAASIVPPPADDRRRGPTFEGATAPPGGPHAEVAALGRSRRRRRGAPRCTSRSSPARTTGGRRPAPTPSSRRGWPGSSSASRTPTRRWPGGASPRCAMAGIEVVGRGGGRRGRRAAGPLPQAPHAPGSPWVVLKMAASLDARTAAPDGTSRWITGEAGPPATRTCCGPAPTPSWWERAPVRADDPELTVRLDDGVERTASRCASCSGRRRRTPGCTRPSSSRAT